MPVSDDIRTLAAQMLDRVDEAREFYVHSRQAWRLVQQLARKGRPVGIVDLATKRYLPLRAAGEVVSIHRQPNQPRMSGHDSADKTFRDQSGSRLLGAQSGRDQPGLPQQGRYRRTLR